MMFMVYPEGCGDSAKVIEAPTRLSAALAFAREEIGDVNHYLRERLIVSDEQARIWIVNATPQVTVEWDAETECECTGADYGADDLMPTPEAEALRDARVAAGLPSAEEPLS